MESKSKAEESAQKAAAAKTAGEEAAAAAAAKDPLPSANDAPATEGRWESIKSKVRTAGEYAALRTRQGISVLKGGGSKEEPQSQHEQQ
ncbi:hypothetical protein ACP4OV_004707 [Aristida adscensionis]